MTSPALSVVPHVFAFVCFTKHQFTQGFESMQEGSLSSLRPPPGMLDLFRCTRLDVVQDQYAASPLCKAPRPMKYIYRGLSTKSKALSVGLPPLVRNNEAYQHYKNLNYRTAHSVTFAWNKVQKMNLTVQIA